MWLRFGWFGILCVFVDDGDDFSAVSARMIPCMAISVHLRWRIKHSHTLESPPLGDAMSTQFDQVTAIRRWPIHRITDGAIHARSPGPIYARSVRLLFQMSGNATDYTGGCILRG